MATKRRQAEEGDWPGTIFWKQTRATATIFAYDDPAMIDKAEGLHRRMLCRMGRPDTYVKWEKMWAKGMGRSGLGIPGTMSRESKIMTLKVIYLCIFPPRSEVFIGFTDTGGKMHK